MTTPPTFLVTGATGYLGRHVFEALSRVLPSARPVALVRDVRQWEELDWQQAERPIPAIAGRLDQPDTFRDDPRLGELGGIFHLAGEVKHTRRDTEGMRRTNVEGTLAMVRLAAEKKCRLVFVSSSGTVSCFKEPHGAADEEAPFCEETVGTWPYYASKIEAERGARKLADELGVELVIVRPPVLLGPGDHRFRSTNNVMRVLKRRLPFILGGGMHFVDIRDVADAMVRAMVHGSPRPVYHFRGEATTLDGFFRQVAKEAGYEPSWVTLPKAVSWNLARLNLALGSKLSVLPDPVVVEMGSHFWDVKSTYAEEDLGFRNRAPSETLRDTIAWLREHHPVLNPNAKPIAEHLLHH
jgi:dihydroflavonol-4-reductase